MNGKQLKKIISELVRKEVRSYKDELIKEIRTEVKSELFDMIMSNKTSVNESVQSEPEQKSRDIDRTSLRELFERHVAGGDDFVSPPPVTTQSLPIPSTFVGKDDSGTTVKPNDMERTMGVITKDYSALMRAMEKKR